MFDITIFQLICLYSVVGLVWGWAIFGDGPLMNIVVNNALPTKPPYIRPSRRPGYIKPLLGKPTASTPDVSAQTKMKSQVKTAKQRLNNLEGNA